MTFTLKVNWFHSLIRFTSRRIGIAARTQTFLRRFQSTATFRSLRAI